MNSYTAARTPRFDSLAAWAEIFGGYPASQPLSDDQTADVVIIGAGFAGLSVDQLAPSLRVSVLDALHVGQGTASRNSGFISICHMIWPPMMMRVPAPTQR